MKRERERREGETRKQLLKAYESRSQGGFPPKNRSRLGVTVNAVRKQQQAALPDDWIITRASFTIVVLLHLLLLIISTYSGEQQTNHRWRSLQIALCETVTYTPYFSLPASARTLFKPPSRHG